MLRPFLMQEDAMKHKATEKLFNIVYMDSLTETYNRVSYDERLKKLRRNRTLLNNMTVVVINLYELQQIIAAYGLHTSDEAVCFVVDTLKKTIGEQADIYRVSAQEFVCIVNKNILPYVSQFMDFMSFENKDRCCKVHVVVGYEVYNSRRHKSIDDLLKSCELKMRKEKNKGF